MFELGVEMFWCIFFFLFFCGRGCDKLTAPARIGIKVATGKSNLGTHQKRFICSSKS